MLCAACLFGDRFGGGAGGLWPEKHGMEIQNGSMADFSATRPLFETYDPTDTNSFYLHREKGKGEEW